MADVFISYLREDIDAAEQLAGALEAHGWSVFWDRRIPAGRRFDDFLDEQLHAARCVVVLWSHGSILSNWVRDEAAVGRERGILVPARLDDVLAPFGFRAIQCASLIGWQGDTNDWGFQQLLHAVRAVMQVTDNLVFAGGEPSRLFNRHEETEAQWRTEEEARRLREKQEAEAKRRAEEEARCLREKQEAEAKRRADEEARRSMEANREPGNEGQLTVELAEDFPAGKYGLADVEPVERVGKWTYPTSSSKRIFVSSIILVVVLGVGGAFVLRQGEPERTVEQDVQASSGEGATGPLVAALDGPQKASVEDQEGVKQDYTDAVKRAESVAQEAQDDADAMHASFEGASQDGDDTVNRLRMAADQGDASAQNSLGAIYDNGEGVAEDNAEAVKWYRKAAEQGNSDGQNNLGAMYGNGEGVAKDDAEAVKWFRKAADQGNASAQFNLGMRYDNGRGVAESDVQAVRWYRKAADQGNAEAQNHLGVMYANGSGVSRNYTEAAKWFRRAADQGNAVAQGHLGWMYANGRGVSKNDVEAVKWYRKAADQGNADAQNNLGWMYANGRGVAKDEAAAVQWYRTAAERQLALAQTNLAVMLETGRGVVRDDAEAIQWYRKAAEQGDPGARARLKELQVRLH